MMPQCVKEQQWKQTNDSDSDSDEMWCERFTSLATLTESTTTVLSQYKPIPMIKQPQQKDQSVFVKLFCSMNMIHLV